MPPRLTSAPGGNQTKAQARHRGGAPAHQSDQKLSAGVGSAPRALPVAASPQDLRVLHAGAAGAAGALVALPEGPVGAVEGTRSVGATGDAPGLRSFALGFAGADAQR